MDELGLRKSSDAPLRDGTNETTMMPRFYNGDEVGNDFYMGKILQTGLGNGVVVVVVVVIFLFAICLYLFCLFPC